jgi:hypothetical protein
MLHLDNWIDNLYYETKKEWSEHGCGSSGYAIFYSPVVLKCAIMIIGYNPGGGSESFNEKEIKAPTEHDYIKGDYKLAQKMRTVFEELKPEYPLEDTVKLNMIFFRSKKASDLENKNLIEYCERKVKEIIDTLEPKTIITEGFKTFDNLLKIMNGEELQDNYEENRGKRIVRLGKIKNEVNVVGLIHPSGARGVSNERLKMMGKFIKKYLKS